MDSTLLYHLALFLHILGAFGLVAAMTFEVIGLQGLRRAIRTEDALTWLGVARVVQRLAPASLGLILVMGLYMTATNWGPSGWILVSLAALVAIGLIGGLLTGVRMARIGPAIGRSSGPLSHELRAALRDPILLDSLGTRSGLVLGILLLMTLKPALVPSLVIVVLAGAMALLTARISSRTSPARSPSPARPRVH
jgi:hypothetical protein